MNLSVRQYHPSDIFSIYRICYCAGSKRTGAFPDYDAELLGNYYAAPYVLSEPDLCFVVTSDGTPCGYVLGTRDSDVFSAWMEKVWLPPLRIRYAIPPESDESSSARLIRRIHRGYSMNPIFSGYPAHLHIDLLPETQGHGYGGRLMNLFLDKLRSLGVPGVHLGVDASNQRAVKFYEKMGFQLLNNGQQKSLAFVMKLASG